MKTIAPLILGLLLLPLGQAHAQTHQDVPLAAIAGAARYRLSSSPENLYLGLDAQSKAAFAATLNTAPLDERPDIWPQIMAGATQVRHEDGNEAHILWYNPIFDVGLISTWHHGATGWVATRTQAVLGESLRQEPRALMTGVAPFSYAVNAPAKTISIAKATFAKAQASDFQHPLTKVQDDQAVNQRLNEAHVSMILMMGSPGYHDINRRLYGYLVTHRAAKGALATVLDHMGDTARQTLRPVKAYRSRMGWAIILQSPDAPAIAIEAHFADPKDPKKSEKAHLIGFSVLDFRKTETQP